MSAYDTYRHTHCSMLFRAFICSEDMATDNENGYD